MSHIHHVGGNLNAADYQTYLDRLRAARLARRGPLSGPDGAAFTFDSAIDPDREGEQKEREEQEPEPERESRQEPAPEGQGGSLNEQA